MIDRINTLEVVKVSIAQCLKLPYEKISDEDEFSSFGLDSIVAMELVGVLSKNIGCKLTPAMFASVRTISELAAHIDALLYKQSSTKSSDHKIDSDQFDDGEASHVEKCSDSDRAGHNAEKIVEAINYIKEHYNIDLSPFRFNSLEDVVNTMVAEHGEGLASKLGVMSSFVDNDLKSSFIKPSSNQKQPIPSVVITGISCRLPDSESHFEFYNNLLERKVSLKKVVNKNCFSEYGEAKKGSDSGGQFWGAKIDGVENFDWEYFGISENEAHLMDPQERLLLEQVHNAINDSGIRLSTLAGSNTGVFVGYEYFEYETALRNFKPVVDHLPPFTSSQTAFYLANRISNVYDLRGPCETFNVNCASSALAINRAYHALVSGECDIALVCGVSLNLFDGDYAALAARGLLSTNGTCDVFGENANGYSRGEGVAAVLIERNIQLDTDGRRVYAKIKASTQRNRGASAQMVEIKHEAITQTISSAYDNGDIESHALSYIEVNGYCTKWGDAFEFEGIKNVFKNVKHKGKHCALGSLKPNIGHLEPANGIVSLIKVALSLFHGRFPPTVSSEKVSSFIDVSDDSHPLYIASSALSVDDLRNGSSPVVAGVNSFSDTGVNVHFVLEEAVVKKQNRQAQPSKNIFLLSGKNHAALMRYVESFLKYLKSPDTEGLDLASLNYTLQCGRDYMEFRLAIIADTIDELVEKLELTFGEGVRADSQVLGSGSIYVGAASQKSTLERYITKEMVDFQVESSEEHGRWGELCALWSNGIFNDWDRFWSPLSQSVNIISLPAYPFKKSDCWATRYRPDSADFFKQTSVSRCDPHHHAISVVDEETIRGEQSGIVASIASQLALIVSAICKKNIDEVFYAQSFHSLGFSSLAIVQLLQSINYELDLHLSPVEMIQNDSIEKIAKYLEKKFEDRIDEMVSRLSRISSDYGNGSVDVSGSRVGVDGPAMLVVEQETDLQKIEDSLVDKVLWQGSASEKEYDKTTF